MSRRLFAKIIDKAFLLVLRSSGCFHSYWVDLLLRLLQDVSPFCLLCMACIVRVNAINTCRHATAGLLKAASWELADSSVRRCYCSVHAVDVGQGDQLVLGSWPLHCCVKLAGWRGYWHVWFLLLWQNWNTCWWSSFCFLIERVEKERALWVIRIQWGRWAVMRYIIRKLNCCGEGGSLIVSPL